MIGLGAFQFPTLMSPGSVDTMHGFCDCGGTLTMRVAVEN
jgi:hypothetical protein